MESPSEYLVFEISSMRFAVCLEHVEKVIRAAAPVAIPQSPKTLSGGLDVRGTVIPLLNLRYIFGLEDKPLDPDDRIVIFRIHWNVVFAGVADRVLGVAKWTGSQIDMQCRMFSENSHFFAGVGNFEGASVALCRMDRIPAVRSIASDGFSTGDDFAKGAAF